MTDLDQLLENASTDVKMSLRTVSTPSPEKIHRRAQRRSATRATAAVVLVVSLGASAWLLSRGSDGYLGLGGDALITSEVILQDGVVTEEELRAGAEAVVACLADAGFEAEVNFDEVDGSDDLSGRVDGWPGFTGDVAPGSSEASDRCLDVHLSNNVLLGWGVTIGRLDLDQLRAEDNALVECVERLTGVDFGEVAHDDFGYLTNDGQQTRDAAFEYQDHEPWQTCKEELAAATGAASSTTSIASPTTQTTFTPIVAPDGVTYIEPATEITVVDDLTFVVQESNIGPCLEVRVEGGGAGGCGANLDDPLNVGFGGIRGKAWTSGWAPVGTSEIVITLAGSEIVSVTSFQTVEGYDVLFFFALLPPALGDDAGLPPIQATAFDASGSPLASVSYGD